MFSCDRFYILVYCDCIFCCWQFQVSVAQSPAAGGSESSPPLGDAAMQAYQNMGMQNTAGFYATQQNPYGVLPNSYSSMSDSKL